MSSTWPIHSPLTRTKTQRKKQRNLFARILIYRVILELFTAQFIDLKNKEGKNHKTPDVYSSTYGLKYKMLWCMLEISAVNMPAKETDFHIVVFSMFRFFPFYSISQLVCFKNFLIPSVGMLW